MYDSRKDNADLDGLPKDLRKLLEEVRDFATKVNRRPETILHYAIGANGKVWEKWTNGEGSPTYATGDKIRAYLAAHKGRVGNLTRRGATEEVVE